MRLKHFLVLTSMIVICGCRNSPPSTNRMTEAPALPPAYPEISSTKIDQHLQTQARGEIELALHSQDEFVRAHALETVKLVRLPEGGKQVVAALDDPSPLVRKAAALAAGEMKIKSAEPAVRHRLEVAQYPERLADIFVLHQLGDTQYSHEFEHTAFNSDPGIRGDTAMILGLIDNTSAIPLLLEMMKRDRAPGVGLQAAEALWRLGDKRGLDELVAATISKYPDDQMIALLAIAEPGDRQVRGHVEGLLTADYPEVALVAARAEGMLGSDYGYGVALNGAKSGDPRQRFLATMALGAIGRTDAQPVLATLLKDDVPDVRLAAAGALMQLENGAPGRK